MWISQDRSETPVVLGGLFGVLTVVGFAAVGVNNLDLDEWSGIFTLTTLVVVTLPVLSWISRKENDPTLMKLLVWGMLATAVGVIVRYFVSKVLYDDVSDAGGYSNAAGELAQLFKQGVMTSVPPGLEGRPAETQRVALVLSFVYLVTGASRWAGSVVFAWLAFGGRLMMWRALRRAVPEADHKRYLLLLLFFPSLLYWPASIGKEALMTFALGVVSYGAALLLSDKVKAGSILVFVGGIAGLVIIRPHYGALGVLALGVASLVGTLRGFGGGAGLKSTLVRAVAVCVLLVVAVVVLSQTARFFGDKGSEGGVGGVLEKTLDQTTTGGSSFDPPAVSDPTDLPAAVVTVFFRPFVWEADNASTAFAALESLVMVVMAVVSWRRLAGGVRLMLRRPYLVYVVTFSSGFIVAFSYIGNFGILARQRTVMLALMLAFLAAPPIAKGRGFLMSGSTRSDGRESAPVMSSVQVGASSTEVNASNIRPAPKVTT
jgi:hypothetical protein